MKTLKFISFLILGILSACFVDQTETETLQLTNMTVSELSAALQKGEIKSVDVVKAYLDEMETQASLSAFIHIDSENALQLARKADEEWNVDDHSRPLLGIPLVAKDNIHVAGMPNTAGTPTLRNFSPTESNEVVNRLEAAGAIFVGKTNMHELAFGITSDNTEFGAVANPYNPMLFAGGSSGGTASAVSSGMIPAGLGTDTGGSVRIPAALTGTVGYRPTMGRYPSTAVTPISTTRDTVGLITKNVEDLILLDSAVVDSSDSISPVAPTDIVLGISREFFFTNLDDESAVVVEESLDKLRIAGVTFVEADIPNIEKLLEGSAFPIALYEVARDLSGRTELQCVI